MTTLKRPAAKRKPAPTPSEAEMAGGIQELGTGRMSGVVFAAQELVRMLDAAVEILQAAQATIPAPSLEEVAEMRQGRQPLTPEAYLLGLLHRSILAAENLASDLRAVDPEMLRSVHELRLSGIELNAIEQAVNERNHAGK
jgi:hypothetical protein